MTIYKKRTDSHLYRKIYEKQHGPIPKDTEGRTYEIHHIDGDHSNNDINNLKAVTIQEHYDIHYAQGDITACLLMAKRMKLSPEEKSKLAKKQFENGANPFIDYLTPEQLSNKGKKANRTRVENGTHNFLGKMNPSHERVKNGTHNWQDSEGNRRQQMIRVAAGDHNLVGNNHHQHDSTVYKFKNLDTGESASLTRNDFIKTYGLPSQNVYHMIRGNRKSVKRWVLEP